MDHNDSSKGLATRTDDNPARDGDKSGIAIGLSLETGVGITFANIGLGICFGTAIGLALAPAFARKANEEEAAVNSEMN